MAQVAARRKKEIGIRKVLGASVPLIAGSITKEFLQLVLIANIIAWPLAWYVMNRWLESFAYHVWIGWWVFVMAGGTALAITILTLSVQAIRAALSNPVDALRYE
jgi:putative ABC transport system permease protein